MAFFFRFDSLAEGRIAYYPVDENGQQAPHWQSELVIKDHPEFSGQAHTTTAFSSATKTATAV